MITVTNHLLWSDAFTSSFKKLMAYEDFTSTAKLDLVKLRKKFIETQENILETGKVDREIMSATTEYNVGKFILDEPLSAYLTADDIFNLEPLLEESPNERD